MDQRAIEISVLSSSCVHRSHLCIIFKYLIIFIKKGLSIYGINPKNGKINKHIDLWDNVDNQQFFSPEAMAQVFRQLLDITRTPNLETPNYKVLKKYKSYEVREYQPFLVAQTTMDDKTSVVNSFNPASRDMGLLFNRLAEYIFGGNKTNEKMEMTTPVFTDTSGKMQFVIGSKFKVKYIKFKI